MSDGICVTRSMEEEGVSFCLTITTIRKCMFMYILYSLCVVSCNVGDWVDVECDYSPGVCSEGGTGVVIAKIDGKCFICWAFMNNIN
jgi:hypothetical protein